jgi:integration host factor subunit alpha
MTLTKANLIESIAEANGYSQAKARKITETMLEIIKSALENGEDILIGGFAKFCVNKKEERRGRNPATGDDLYGLIFQWIFGGFFNLETTIISICMDWE